MTKIAVSCEEPTLDSAVDPRFGRAAGFLIVDPETLNFEYVENGAAQAMAQGAGIAAAETVVQAGAAVVLTGFVGPKAFIALSAAGVRVGQNLENLTVREAVERYKAGEVEIADQPNRSRGHWQ
ncbi:MAG TPA: NifB/NifX family molybdenum-iron cluster-binding protein [Desulfobacterales bacterium]